MIFWVNCKIIVLIWQRITCVNALTNSFSLSKLKATKKDQKKAKNPFFCPKIHGKRALRCVYITKNLEFFDRCFFFFLFSSEECRLILSVLLSGLDPHTFIWQKVCYSYPISLWKSTILAVFNQNSVSEWKILCITPYCQMQPVPDVYS